MVAIERGQIYWCGLDPIKGSEQGSTRPVVVISADAYNETRTSLVAVIPLTKSPTKTPLHLRLSPQETGLKMASTVLTDHLRFVDRSRLRGAPIGRLQPSAMALVDRHVSRVLGLGSS